MTNLSRSIVHEMIVVAVENHNAPLPYDPAHGYPMTLARRHLIDGAGTIMAMPIVETSGLRIRTMAFRASSAGP